MCATSTRREITTRRGVTPTVAVVARQRAATRLARALEAEGLRVSAHARAPEALPLTSGTPGVVVVHSPETGPGLLASVRSIRELLPAARTVVVVSPAELRRLRDLLAEGVDAVVLVGDVDRCLGLAVLSACEGLLSLPQSLRATLARPVLSPREKQVLGLVVLGLMNGEIARKLHISESTVKSHLSSSYAKLGARSRNEAVALILDPVIGFGAGILTIASDERPRQR